MPKETIPASAYPVLFKYSKGVYDNTLSLKEAKKLIYEESGVKETSSHYYIYAYSGLMDGVEFKGNISAPSFDYFLEQILQQYGEAQLSKALHALNLHLDYYKDTGKTGELRPLDRLRKVQRKYSRLLRSPQLVTSIDDIRNNIRTFEDYLVSETTELSKFAVRLLKEGVCFVCYEKDAEVRFIPSKFVGYCNNSFETYLDGHGDDSTAAISKVLAFDATPNEEMEAKLLIFSASQAIHLRPTGSFGNRRKFWSKIFIVDDQPNSRPGYSEGGLAERRHKARERNRKLITDAKAAFKKRNGQIFCEVCNFNFFDKYGNLGEDFIEGHHTLPIHAMPPDYKTKLEEIAMVCSNCHRMIHTGKEMLTLDELREIIEKQ